MPVDAYYRPADEEEEDGGSDDPDPGQAWAVVFVSQLFTGKFKNRGEKSLENKAIEKKNIFVQMHNFAFVF